MPRVFAGLHHSLFFLGLTRQVRYPCRLMALPHNKLAGADPHPTPGATTVSKTTPNL